jgi:XTP/dITP diphosphohydrolase
VRIVLASGNRGKIEELRKLLPAWVDVVSVADLGIVLPEETGTTFVENAMLKARAAAEQSGEVALADDSGLEVDALDGQPGVRSSRFAGEPSDDHANNCLLLTRLANVPAHDRTARFRSVVAVVVPGQTEFSADGVVEGRLLAEPRGNNGFGYDPLFLPLDHERTLAEMSLEEKNSISHRGRAFRSAAKQLLAILNSNDTDAEEKQHEH